MKILNSMFIALSTYSKIPVPQAEWSEENMRWSLCFFPLVGAVIAALMLLWLGVCDLLEIGAFLRGAGCVAVSVLVSGGIHLDGYCDTSDAIASYGDREKRLEILRDTHTGAFAVIRCGLYYLLLAGALGELSCGRAGWIAALGFVLSRAMSGFGVVSLKGARKEGFLQSFADAAQARTVRMSLVAVSAACALAMVCIAPGVGVLAVLGACGCFYYYRAMSYKRFGGITGDLAGYFLCLAELTVALIAAIGGKLL